MNFINLNLNNRPQQQRPYTTGLVALVRFPVVFVDVDKET